MIVQDINQLRKKCRETTVEECRKQEIFSKLELELADKGIGLAANQIGYDIRAVIIRLPKLSLNLVSPVIEEYDTPIVYTAEGCLSFPGVRLNTNRYNQVTVRWIDSETGEGKRGVFYGEEAVVCQHEVDHLDGIVLRDRVTQSTIKIGRNEICPFCKELGKQIKWKKCTLHNL